MHVRATRGGMHVRATRGGVVVPRTCHQKISVRGAPFKDAAQDESAHLTGHSTKCKYRLVCAQPIVEGPIAANGRSSVVLETRRSMTL